MRGIINILVSIALLSVASSGREVQAAKPSLGPAVPQAQDQDATAKALRAYNRGEYVTAMQWYRKAAQEGDANAQHAVGALYLNGLGVAPNPHEAMRWFRKAAEQGNSDAQFAIGVMYGTGDSVQLDYAEAMKWYLKAAEQGNSEAQYNIGALYYNGLGIPKNIEEAMKWISKAAEQGNEEAKNKLKELTAASPKFDADQVAALLDKRAPSETPENLTAEYNRGVAYQNGEGVAKNLIQAATWYFRAALQSYEPAKIALARLNVRVIGQRTFIFTPGSPDAAEKILNGIPDEADVVAQVLNYSDCGDDGGCETFKRINSPLPVHWLRDPSAKCLYRKAIQFSPQQYYLRDQIDLNDLDPRSLKFGPRIHTGIFGDLKDDVEVTYDGTGIFSASADLDRIRRGWALIYSQYCSGKERPF
jgi:TPR repeat protein